MAAMHKTAAGARAVAISVPARYLHSPSVVIRLSDLTETGRLLEAYLAAQK